MDPLKRTVVKEDVVQYYLFLVQPHSIEYAQANEKHLQHLLEEIWAMVASHLAQYIWQQQPFNLHYHPEKGGIPAHIGGSTAFGDNVEDEWFIVYLLLQITFAFPELAARVEDNDGEFVLIEAADYLPKWLDPETSENRVFLHKGELYILPCPSSSPSLSGGELGLPRDVVPSVAQALVLLSSHPGACLASQEVRAVLRKRLKGYPETLQDGLHQADLHHAHCFLPAGIAAVLARRPDLVAPAVSAFYLRDPVDLQACRTFRTFPPDQRVLASVTFTRCLYAQLQQQQFTPDRRSGFTMPARSDPRYHGYELGMKLAHGFEILCSKCRDLSSSQTDTPVSCYPEWKGFLESLTRNGYFRWELEGSARHRELMTSAENFFKHFVVSNTSSSYPGEEVLQVLQISAPFSLEDGDLPPEDDDSWLDISAQELERMLEERGGGGRVGAGASLLNSTHQTQRVRGEEEEEEASYSLVAMTQGMKAFINTTSSHEGAELPWSLSNEPFRFDPDSMSSALERLLGVKQEELDSDDLEDDDDDEEEEGDDGCPSGPPGEKGAESPGSAWMRKYIDEMDQELLGQSMGQSFTLKKDSEKAGGEMEDEEEEEIQPLDVDLNLITNLLESLTAQEGLAGPASNLLQSLGIHLPPNTDHHS